MSESAENRPHRPNYDRLKDKHKAFVDAYIDPSEDGGGYVGEKSALIAGYAESSARVTACRIMKKPEIQAAITERMMEAAALVNLSRGWVLQALQFNAITTLMPGENHNPAAANRALELLGKEIDGGMFTTRNELTGPGGGPIETRETSTLDTARRLAFLLGAADRELEQEGEDA